MAITGTHMLFNSPEPEALRATLRDVFGWDHVDARDGWLIFKLPPAELAVHPSDGETSHALLLMCDDVTATVAELTDKGIEFLYEPKQAGFGIETTMRLPGGVEVQLYEPRHATAI